MKKIVFFRIYYIILIVFLSSCNEEKVTQRIMGAGDCQSNSGWSWNNGEASTTGNDFENPRTFSFKSTVTGELKFSHKMMETSSGYYSNSFLQVYIGEKMYFKVETGSGGTVSYAESSIGSVKAGEVIEFIGRRYYVKDISIEGVLGGPSNGSTPDNPDTPWDF